MSEKKKVIIINTLSVHLHAGGLKTYLHNFIWSLATITEFNITLICSKDNKTIFSHCNEQFDNVSILNINLNTTNPLRRVLIEQFYLPFRLHKFSSSKTVLIIPSSIALFLCKIPQLVIQQYPQAINGVRREMHKSQISISLFHRIYYGLFIPLSLNKAKANIAVSKYLLDKIVNDHPNIRKSIHLVYEGVDSTKFSPQNSNKENIILFVSTLFPYKNLNLLLTAFSQMPESIRNKFQLRIVGKDPDGTRFMEAKEQIAQLSLDERAHIIGAVPFEEVEREYSRAKVFVYPSSVETFGLPILEAMSMGVPVISSDAMSLPEVMGNAGMLFSDGDSASLKEKLEIVLKDDKLQAELAKLGIEHSKKFNWKYCATSINQILNCEFGLEE